MGLDDIIKSIAKDTEQEIDSLNKETAEQSKKIEAEHATKLKQEKARLLKNLETEAQRKVSQARFQVRSLAKSKVLKKKQELLADVYTKTLAAFGELSEKDYHQILENQLKALPSLEAGEIKASAKDKSAVNKIADKLKLKYKVSEAVLRSLIESAEKEEEYWLEITKRKDKEIESLKKEVSHWKGQYKAKLKRDKNKEIVLIHSLKIKILSLLKKDENKKGIPLENLQNTIDYLEETNQKELINGN